MQISCGPITRLMSEFYPTVDATKQQQQQQQPDRKQPNRMAATQAASRRSPRVPRGAASLTSQLVKSNDGSAMPNKANHKRTDHKQQRPTRGSTDTMRVLLTATCLMFAAVLLLAPISAEAKTHPSKRQAQPQQQLQQQQQPASGGRDQTNWWNLWWQQYINEAQQPTVRPIVSVSFNGQTIDASNFLNDIERARPNEAAAGQLRQGKALTGGQQQAPNGGNWAAVKPKMFQVRQTSAEQSAARTNRQVNDERPVIMMQQQTLTDDNDDQMNQIQLSSGRQSPPPPRPQVSNEFGIQMRPKPNAARQQQASLSNQRAPQRQELERLRQLQQQRQQVLIDSEYLEQQQLQHQVSDYAEDAELEPNAIAQNGTGGGQANMDENEVQSANGAIDSSSSSMMMPDRPKATTGQQVTSSTATSTTSAPSTTVSGRADTPSSPVSQSGETTTTKRPENASEQTTTTIAPGNRLSTGSPSSTSTQQQQQRQETSGATQAATSTTQTPLPMTTSEQQASETPISIGGEDQNGATGGPQASSKQAETTSTTTQRQQPKQTTPSGQDRVELQNGRPATSGMMFVSGRPQLFGTSASTTTTTLPPTTTTGSTTRFSSTESSSSGGTEAGSSTVAAPTSEQPKASTTSAGSTNVTMTATTSASDSDSDSDDESEEEQPGSNLNNNSSNGESAGNDSDSDGEEEEGDDDNSDSDGGANQEGAGNTTTTTTTATSGQTASTAATSMGTGSSSSGSSSGGPTTRQPMLTTGDIELERLPKMNESRGQQPTSQVTSSPSSASTQSTKMDRGNSVEEFARVTDGSTMSTAALPSSNDGANQRPQQVLMMTVDASRGTLDGETAITVPMDAVMRMMMTQNQINEQTSTTTTQRPGQQTATSTTSGPTQPATSDASNASDSTTSGRLTQQAQTDQRQQTSTSPSRGGQQQSTPAAPPSSATSTTAANTMTTRKKLQPPPTTRTPGSNMSASTSPQPAQDSVAPMGQFTRQRDEVAQTGANSGTTATGVGSQMSSSPGSVGNMEADFMGMTTGAMNLDDEAGGREPKIELLNMDLVPIQRIMNSMTSTTTSQPATRMSQQQQQTSIKTTSPTPSDMQQQAMNVDVEPGMRLRPPSSQQPRVTMIEQVRPSTSRMQQQQQQTSTSSRPPAPPSMMSEGVSVVPNQMNQMNTVYMIMMPPEFAANNTIAGQQSGDLQMMIRNQQDQQSTRDQTSQMKQMLAMLQTAAEQERIKSQQQQQTTMRITSQTSPAVTSTSTTPARPMTQQTTMLNRMTSSSQRPTSVQTSTTTTSATGRQQQQPTMTTSGQQLMRISSPVATTAGGVSTQTVPPTTTTARPRFVSKEEFLETVRANQQAGASDRSPGAGRMQTSGQQTTMAPTTTTATLKPAGGSTQTGGERPTSSSTTAAASSSPSSSSSPTTTSPTITTGRPTTPVVATMPPTGGREREGQSSPQEEALKPIQPLMVVVQLQNGTRVATPVNRMPPSDTLAALRQSTSTTLSGDQRTQTTQPAGGSQDASSTSTISVGGGQRPPSPSRRPAGVKSNVQKTSPQNATASFIPAKLRQDFGVKPTSQTINEINAGGRKAAKLMNVGEQRQQPANLTQQLQQQQQQDSAPATTPSPMVQSMAIRQFGGANRMSALAQQPVAFGRPATMMIVPAGQSGASARLQQSSGAQYPPVPTFEYGPSIAVRRPDEPLANGQMPNCTLTGKNFCVLTKDYPMNEVRQAVERSFRSVRIMYEELQTVSDQELHKEDFKNATSSQAASGQFACQTQVEMMRPGWAKDEITREWMLVVNTDVFPQKVRTESCAQPNTPCEFIAPFYDSTCQQRYSLHRMIAIDPHDPTRSPQVAVFKFPAGCVCRVHPIRKGSSTQSPVTPLRQTTTTSAPTTTTTKVPSTTINVATSTSIRRRR